MLLYRQINPRCLQDGEFSSEAFTPSYRDQKKLSVDNGDLVSPEDAYKRFIAHKWATVGVGQVSNTDCDSLELPVIADPSKDNIAHTLIDFSGLNESEIIEKAIALTDIAIKRGWAYKPEF